MELSPKLGWASFILAVAALAATGTSSLAGNSAPESPVLANPLEARLSRIAAELKQKAAELPVELTTSDLSEANQHMLLARGFGNVNNRGAWVNNRGGGWRNNVGGWRNGGGGWVNTRGPGWVNGGGGTFANWNNPWRNGWGDGGSFWNW